MEDNGITKITVERRGEKIVMKVCSDSDIWDWKSIFTSILAFLTFHPNTIAELFKDED